MTMTRQRSEEHDRHEQLNGQGANPPPTRAPLAPRSGSPAEYNTSGMERALGQLADKTHRSR
jgi:hypothetical protein